MAAACDRTAPVPAAPGGAGRAPDPLREMAAEIRLRIAAHRERAASAHPALASARSLAHKTFSRQEQLQGLKDQLRELESQLAEALSVRSCKESKHKLTTELISSTTAMNERLNNSVLDQKNMMNKQTAAISHQLQALEAKSNEGAALWENIEEAVFWYEKALGFQVLGDEGEGAKFVFKKIDPQSPEREYSFCVKSDRDSYKLLQCDQHIEDIEELVKDLSLNDDFFKFVRIIREKFRSSAANGTLPVSPVVGPDVSAAPFPSPVMTSVNGRSEDVSNQSHSRRKNKRQPLPAKRRATALSVASPGSLRRSPRFEGMR